MSFLHPDEIERIASIDFVSYKDKKGIVEATFPLDPESLFYTLFWLITRYVNFD